MELNLIREHSYDRGALADSFTALRIEPTTYGLKVTCSNHCATCSYSLDIWVWIFLIDYLVEKKFLTRHLAIRDFWQLITALRYSGAMVRASAFHVLACRFNPRYCESVRQCSSHGNCAPWSGWAPSFAILLRPKLQARMLRTHPSVKSRLRIAVSHSTQLKTNSFYKFLAETCPDVCCFTI